MDKSHALQLDFNNYKHISFDLWLTLIKSNPEFKKKRNEMFKDYFNLSHSIEQISQSIRYYDVTCNNINEKTGLNLDTFEIYCFILGALGVDFSLINQEKLQGFYDLSEELFLKYKPILLYPNLKETLNRYKESGVTMNILSNTGFIKGTTLNKILSYYEIDSFFDFKIYSDECGYSKPNAKIFELIHQKIPHIKKEEILHVGDNKQADYHGAIAFGFKAHLI